MLYRLQAPFTYLINIIYDYPIVKYYGFTAACSYCFSYPYFSELTSIDSMWGQLWGHLLTMPIPGLIPAKHLQQQIEGEQ
jgi:hypothetical protein